MAFIYAGFGFLILVAFMVRRFFEVMHHSEEQIRPMTVGYDSGEEQFPRMKAA